MKKRVYDVVVVGSGIAGMSCSLYLKRNNLDILLIENNIPGGQINYTSVIENYPGFSSIDGVTFNMNVLEQLKKLDIQPRNYEIKEILKGRGYKRLITSKEEILTKNIVVATGRKPKGLNLKDEELFIGRGISWCALCDGSLYKDKEVVVIGGGASSLEEALYLSKICNKVTIINKNKEFKADNKLINAVLSNSKIDIIYEAITTAYNHTNNILTGVTILKDGVSSQIKCVGIFIYIGYYPNSKVVDGLNMKRDNGYIVTNKKGMTSINKIYACGDVVKKDFYQIILAAASGVNVALNIIKSIK